MIKQLLGIATACVFTFSITGCSMFGKGKKDGMEGEEGALSEADLDAQREGRFASGSIPTAEGEGALRDVHFDFDSAEITDAGRQDIEYNAEVLKANPGVKVQLEGNTDERGTNEYNLALGEKRARAVLDVLASYGVDRSRLSSISYGEESPLDQGSNETAWAKNRRVHSSAFSGDAG